MNNGMAADRQVSVEIRVEDADQARELEQLLQDAGAQEVETREADPGEVRGLAFIPIIIGAVIGVTALVDVYLRWRRNHMCQEIIDVRKEDKPVITKNCEIKDGRIIVLLPEGKIEIHEVPDGVNVGDVIKAAINAGAEAAKAVAEKLGVKVEGPKPIQE
jgi:hypothetical protein